MHTNKDTINAVSAMMRSDPRLPISLWQLLTSLAEGADDGGSFYIIINGAEFSRVPADFDAEMVARRDAPRMAATSAATNIYDTFLGQRSVIGDEVAFAVGHVHVSDDARGRVCVGFTCADAMATLRSIPGARFDGDSKTWSVHGTGHAELARLSPPMARQVEVAETAHVSCRMIGSTMFKASRRSSRNSSRAGSARTRSMPDWGDTATGISMSAAEREWQKGWQTFREFLSRCDIEKPLGEVW